MDNTYEKIMDIIITERHKEELCAEKSKWIMKKSFNPIRKINSYLSARKFMYHVAGMDLIIRKLSNLKEEA